MWNNNSCRTNCNRMSYNFMKKLFLILLLLCSNAFADLTDIKFGQSQIADSQLNVNACLNTTTCQIYSKNPGTAYKIPWTSGQVSWASGDYVKFNTSGNGSFPYTAVQYTSAGAVKATLGNGKIVNMGPDYFFFVGSDNNTGQLFSGSSGMNNTAGVSWTGTLNPTVTQANTYANANYSTVPLTAGQTATTTPSSSTPTPNWQMIRTTSSPVVISNIYPTSNNSPSNETAVNAFDGNVGTKYLNFDKQNAGVTVKLNQGRVVKKFTITTANDAVERDPASYKLYGSNDGVTWVLLSEGALSLSDSRFAVSGEITVANTNAYIYYFIKFPSIKNNSGNSVQVSEVTYYYDLDDGVISTDTGSGGTPSNPGQAGSVCADCAPSWPATSDISAGQSSTKAAAKARVANIQLGNHLYIEQKIGSSNNNVTVEQTGNYNKIAGLGGATYAVLSGNSNTVNIKQGDTLGRNLIEFSVTGNTNNVTIWQARDVTNGVQDGTESGGHYAGLGITGNSNTVSIKQGNQGGSDSGHFGLMYITGSNNNVSLKQGMNGEKTAFITVDGSNNIGSITQWGGTHYTDLVLTGNGHKADITQSGVTTHKATINLTNNGGASNVTLIQQGTTAQNINITQQCATLSGCSVSVTQGQ